MAYCACIDGILCMCIDGTLCIGRDSGKMWNASNKLEDCKAVIPDRSYATFYAEVVNYVKSAPPPLMLPLMMNGQKLLS